MNVIAIVVLIDILMSFLVVVYTVNHLRLKEEYEEKYGEPEEVSEKDEEPEYPELVIDEECLVKRRFCESRSYRGSDGVLHLDYPRYRVEVELETPVNCEVPVNRVKLTRVDPEIEFIGYVCEGGKRIIEN